MQKTAMKLVGYQRTSTEDRGQDADRQKMVITRWAESRGHTILGWHVDDGISGTTDPFQRQGVLEAIEQAEAEKADGIVIESVDRWTRSGIDQFAASRFFLKADHKLNLYMADIPGGLGELGEQLMVSIMAAVAQEFHRRLSESIKAGIANAKAKGWPKGQPGRAKKPDLTPNEQRTVTQMVADGHGSRMIAVRISVDRAGLIADRKIRAEKEVTQTWIRSQMKVHMPEVLALMSSFKSKAHKKNKAMAKAAKMLEPETVEASK